VSVAAGVRDKADAVLTVAIVNEDTGGYGDKLITILENSEHLRFVTATAAHAESLLRRDRAEAAVTILADVTEKLQNGEYKDTLSLEISPYTSSAAAVTEPLINAVIMLWVRGKSCRHDRRQPVG
jgi:hypothetical protein